MSRFVQVDRETAYLLPPSVQEWLPQDHLARYVVDVVEALDLSELVRQYAGRGSDAHHPGTLLGLLIYGYATGVQSSRAIERASYDSVAFRFVAGNTHPDHDTIATFRRRFAEEVKALFVQVLLIARTNGVLKLGNVALDGTKVKANASRHSALSHGHALKLKEQLQAEVEQLLRLAEAADASERPEGMDIPQELARREQRLARIEEAKAQIEAAAAQDYEQAQAQFEAKQAERERRQNEGRRPPGPAPAPPSPNEVPAVPAARREPRQRGMGLGVPCLQRKADAPDAGNLNQGYEPINHPLAACRLRGNQERSPMHSHRPLITPSPTGC